mgnify:CR=1 FL=1
MSSLVFVLATLFCLHSRAISGPSVGADGTGFWVPLHSRSPVELTERRIERRAPELYPVARKGRAIAVSGAAIHAVGLGIVIQSVVGIFPTSLNSGRSGLFLLAGGARHVEAL